MNEHSGSEGHSAGPMNVPTGPLEIAPDCWMVGHRNPETILQCNTYVRRFGGPDSDYNLCIDPGSQYDFSVIEGNVAQLIGGLGEIHGFTVNHQDPDVVGNSPYLCEANPKIEMFVTEEVWRLLQHMLFKPGGLKFVSTASRSGATKVTSHHRLKLVPTPFCHFRGAMAFYDPEIRTLFTGDLCGGFNRIGGVQMTAVEDDWLGIAQFHQIYMPSREVLRHAVREILSLSPPVRTIAPQHGHVIKGNLVQLFLDRMYDLPVGYDLLASAWDHEKLEDYREVIRQLIARAELTLGAEEVRHRLTTSDVDDELEHQLRFRGSDVQLNREGYSAVVKVFTRLIRQQRVEFVVALRSLVLNACSERGLPIPPVGAGIEKELDVGNHGV